jgi:hypothetical protein
MNSRAGCDWILYGDMRIEGREKGVDWKGYLCRWFGGVPSLAPITMREVDEKDHMARDLEEKEIYGCVTAHPHACGERMSPITSLGQNIGSSPRVWGTLFSLSSPERTFFLTMTHDHAGHPGWHQRGTRITDQTAAPSSRFWRGDQMNLLPSTCSNKTR